MHKAIANFRDLTDKHDYVEGDKFPFDGREIDAKRISELASTGNKLNKVLIVEVKEQKKESTPKKDAGQDAE
jgi:hypothetical protein